MATKYYTVMARIAQSESSSYSPFARLEEWRHQLSADSSVWAQEITATTGGKVVELGNLTTVNYWVVKNLSSTISVTATWDDAGGTARSMVIGAGKVAIVPDARPNADLTLTAASSTVQCQVLVIGAA